MTTAEPVASSTITVFTRHSDECPKADNPQWRRCNCRKSLYIREGGKTAYLSAKTRSWDQTERVAQVARDKRDPVKIELQKISESEAAKHAAKLSKLKPFDEALDQWLTGMKGPGGSSIDAYKSTTVAGRFSRKSTETAGWEKPRNLSPPGRVGANLWLDTRTCSTLSLQRLDRH
jgi:hypothetical protein